jgi:hypothetical protein
VESSSAPNAAGRQDRFLGRWLNDLAANYHLTRSETQLVAIGFYLVVVLVVIAVILAIRKALSRAPQPQSATGARSCPACGVVSSGVRFCPQCGQKMS